MKKIRILLTIIALLLPAAFSIQAQTKADFDRSVDFALILKNFYIASGDTDYKAVTDKLVILDGTVTTIYPTAFLGFLYQVSEITYPAQFVRKFEKPDNKVVQLLADILSSKTKKLLVDAGESEKVAAIIKELNSFLRSERLWAPALFTGFQVPDYIKEIAAIELEDDEQAFLNRLLVDTVFKGIVKPVEIQIEIKTGEWYDYTKVEAYSGLIKLNGNDAFRLFSRRDPQASKYKQTLTLNSRIVVVARPLSVVKLPAYDQMVWLFESIYLRGL